jgi:hypothetical protein
MPGQKAPLKVSQFYCPRPLLPSQNVGDAIDAPGIGEIAVATRMTAVVVTDAPATADDVTQNTSQPRTVADVLSTSELATGGKSLTRDVTEALSTAEATGDLPQHFISAAESLRVSESVEPAIVHPPLNTSEAVTRTLVASRAATESPFTADVVDAPSIVHAPLHTSEAVTRTLAASRAATESLFTPTQLMRQPSSTRRYTQARLQHAR